MSFRMQEVEMNFSFTKGQHLKIDGIGYCINLFNEKNQYQLIGEDGDLLIRSWDELIQLYKDKRLTLSRSEESAIHIAHEKVDLDSLPDITGFTPRQVEQACLKHLCIEYVLSKGKWCSTPQTLQPLVDEFLLLYGNGRVYKHAAIQKAHKRYCESGGNWRAQLPMTYRQGNRKSRLPKEASGLMKTIFEELYLDNQQLTIAQVYRHLELKIFEINKQRSEQSKIKTPDISSLYRLRDKYGKYILVSARKGHIEAKKEFTTGFKVERPSRPMERVEIDHTVLDIVLIDEISGLPWGRPTITLAVDCFSGCIVGMYLSPDPPSLKAVLGCLRHICLPKNSESPEMIDLDWPCFGIPGTLVCDNASEFHSKGFIHIALDLGIEIPYCGVGQGNNKGSVERAIGVMAKMFCHKLPGTTLSRYEDLGAYDPEKMAAITFQRFVRIINQWICTEHHNMPDADTAKTPIELWREGARSADIRLPRDPALLERLLGNTSAYVLRKGPLVIDKIAYNSPELGHLRRVIGLGERIMVRSFDDDLSYVEVIHPETKQPLRIDAEDQSYTKGLTRFMHRLVRAKIRQEYKEKIRDPNFMEARLSLYKEINEAVIEGKKIKRKHKMSVKAVSSLNPAGKDSTVDVSPEESGRDYKWRDTSVITSGFDVE